MDEAKPQYAATPSPDVEEHMSVSHYISTRISSLVPPMNPAPNPFKALTLLNRTQWLNFTVCRFPVGLADKRKDLANQPNPTGRISGLVLGLF
jgi:hypothetical protein